MVEDKPKFLLLEKVKALYTLLHPVLKQFPKSVRFTLRSRIEDGVLDTITCLVRQNYCRSVCNRRDLLVEALASINLVEVLLQQALTFKYLPYKHYENARGLLGEVEAMMGARIRNLNAGGGGEDENL